MKARRKRQQGASLIEIIVAVGVLAVGLYAIATGLQSARAGTAVALRAMKAETIASNVVELLQCSAPDLERKLGQTTQARIPAEGYTAWEADRSYAWAAKVERLSNKPAALVEVTVVRTKDAPATPLATAKGLVVLGGDAR